MRYIGRHVSWKWEHLQMFLVRLQPVLPILLQFFDARKMVGKAAAADAQEEVSEAVIKRCKIALDHPGLQLYVHIARCISKVADRCGTWCEGCSCHESLLSSSEPSRVRKRQFAAASADCPWKGCRAPELAAGHWRRFLADIDGATDRWMQQAYADATPEDRAIGSDFERSVKELLGQLLRDRLGFWDKLPFRIFAVYACARGVISTSEARRIGKECLQEYTTTVQAGLTHKLHRVAHYFLAPGTALSAQLHEFTSGRGELSDYSLLHNELRAYSLSPTVCRRIESTHSEWRSITKKICIGRFAWKAAALRRADICAELDASPAFLRFLQLEWRKRRWLQGALHCLFENDLKTLQEMPRVKQLGWWYQCTAEAQFRSLETQQAQLVVFNKLVRPCHKPITQQFSEAQHMLARFIKSIFHGHVGAYWSLPRELVDAPGAPWACNMLDLFARVAAASAEAAEGDESPVDLSQLCFFTVTDAYPEAKHFVRPSHDADTNYQVVIREVVAARREDRSAK